jgi:hypothetical protein
MLMTHEAELATLERLLDDPSPVVRLAVLSKIKAAGVPGVLWLETLTKDEALAAHARTLLADLRTPEAAAHAFLTHIRDPHCDLEEACLLLERATDPSLADDTYSAELDRLAAHRDGAVGPLTLDLLLGRQVIGIDGQEPANPGVLELQDAGLHKPLFEKVCSDLNVLFQCSFLIG